MSANSLVSVEVTPHQISLARGSTHQFKATINGTETTLKGASWTLQGATSPGTNISSNGLLTVNSRDTANTLTVRATSTSNNDIFGIATVSLTGAIVTEITIYPNSVNVSKGASQDFTATVTGHYNPPQTVSWSVSGNGSGSTTINSNGRLFVAENETAMNLTVTATSTYDNRVSNTAIVTVSAPNVTFNASDVSQWNQAVNSIRNGGNNRVYTINITSEISLPVSTGNTFGSVIGLQVTLQGGGTLLKSANGQLLGIGGSQTLIARNITMDGMNRTTAVVNVEGGTFQMEDGAIVKNNNSTGVWVSGGSLVMRGGSIFENNVTGDSLGGGVTLLGASSFLMHAGATISNNTVSGSSTGGGVFISSGSLFTMEGGVISSNTNNSTSGGGIHARGGFILNNGEISHNRAQGQSSGGGGVFVFSHESNNTFTMNGGQIQNNSAGGFGGGVEVSISSWGGTVSFNMNGGFILNNSSGRSGGGVMVGGSWNRSSVFNMNGGTISNNTSVVNGGGVYISEQNLHEFHKTGGTISNNVATGQGNTAFHAVTPNRWRNANAGPSINTADYGFWLND
jgi:hypothetical protein